MLTALTIVCAYEQFLLKIDHKMEKAVITLGKFRQSVVDFRYQTTTVTFATTLSSTETNVCKKQSTDLVRVCKNAIMHSG
jgi:hypothetical protein